MTNSPIPGDVVAGTGQNIGLRGLSAQLKRMIQHTQFVMDGFVRVRDPLYLIDKLDEAADLIEALQRELAEKTAQLEKVNAEIEDEGLEWHEDDAGNLGLVNQVAIHHAGRALKAEALASSARRLALEEADLIVREEWNAFAKVRGVTAEAMIAAILNRLRDTTPAAIRDIKGET